MLKIVKNNPLPGTFPKSKLLLFENTSAAPNSSRAFAEME
jgi:hypothetical protein